MSVLSNHRPLPAKNIKIINLPFSLLFISIVFTSCQSRPVSFSAQPKEVVISGQVINRSSYDPNSMAIIINDVASSEQLRVVSNLDKDGRFEARFERFYPQEVMVKFNTIYEVYVHPGDSIHIKIDAKKQGTDEDCFHAISFSGDAVKENEQLIKFQEWFSSIKKNKSDNNVPESRYNPERYLQYRDSLRNSYQQYRIGFVKKNKVSPSIGTWIYYEVEGDFFYNMWLYPLNHKRLNNYPSNWDVPVSYYDFYKKANLTIESLSNAEYTKPFALHYYSFYIRNKIQEDLRNKGLVRDTISSDGKQIHLWKVTNSDSILIDGINKYTHEGLLRQLVYNLFFKLKLRQDNNTVFFDKYSSLISQEIKEPFLIIPLQKNYKDIREIAENPNNNRKPLIIDSENTPGRDILKQIVETNRGKVIYIDCWATWCGPCIAEMPYSKKLMTELKDEAVTFVYLSFNSPMKEAQKRMVELKMGGTHYFLNVDQGNHLQKIFSFSSFPNYVLIDKWGQIVKSGSDLVPESEGTKKDIIKLINQK